MRPLRPGSDQAHFSPEDVQKLRLRELMLKGTPENVRVQFERRGKQRELPLEVLDELRKRGELKPADEEARISAPLGVTCK